jgi:4-hydroxy-3-methylbut-2-enyl diphosphate reductase
MPWHQPVAVVRAISDTSTTGLLSPAIIRGGWQALRSLRRAAPVLEEWAGAVGAKRVLLAAPRSFCAGVERAIQTVERVLEQHGTPVYVRRQIVHNRHVVAQLEERGAIFVHELDEVPDGATVVFSAHGVAPSVRTEAAARGLQVVDATCPLVAKVHHEVRRFQSRGYQVVLIGHAGHDETEGTLGEGHGVTLIEHARDIAALEVDDPEHLAYVTQTTLSPDDVAGLVGGLTVRYPAIVGPHAADVCYATQNRQDAVRAIAGACDVLLVIGSPNSSNTVRLAEVAARAGCRAELLEDDTGLDLAWLHGASTIGVTAGASAPPALVERVVGALATLGPIDVEERSVRHEQVNFPLPAEVR